jgi:hypothetical protein
VPIQSIPTFATGDTIEASWANDLRDNGLVLDARTGGDPGGAGKWLESTGGLGAGWKARATAVLEAIGFTPANKDGETFTAPISMPSSSVVAKRNDTGDGGALILQESGVQRRAVVENAGNAVKIYDVVNGPISFVLNLATGVLGAIGASFVGGGGNPLVTIRQTLGTTSYGLGIRNTADSAWLLLFRESDGALLTVPVVSTGTVSGTQLAATVSDFSTPPLAVHANQAGVTVPNLRAASAEVADGATNATNAVTAGALAAGALTDAMVAAANKDGTATTPSLRTLGTGSTQAAAGNHGHTGMALLSSGTYTGNGSSTQAVALGVSAKLVVVTEVTDGSNGVMAQAVAGKTFSTRLISGVTAGAADATNGISGTNLVASFAAGINTGGKTYSWAAFA